VNCLVTEQIGNGVSAVKATLPLPIGEPPGVAQHHLAPMQHRHRPPGRGMQPREGPGHALQGGNVEIGHHATSCAPMRGRRIGGGG
jgi:hypothetical protein